MYECIYSLADIMFFLALDANMVYCQTEKADENWDKTGIYTATRPCWIGKDFIQTRYWTWDVPARHKCHHFTNGEAVGPEPSRIYRQFRMEPRDCVTKVRPVLFLLKQAGVLRNLKQCSLSSTKLTILDILFDLGEWSHLCNRRPE